MNNENNYFYGKIYLLQGELNDWKTSGEDFIKKKAKVTVVSLDKDNSQSDSVKFINADLRDFNQCLKICKNMDIVFQLAGVKGSPAMTSQRPASFFVPTIMMSINMMEGNGKEEIM